MTRSADTPGDRISFGCGVAARWLPRALAGSLLATALIVTMRVDPDSVVAGSRGFRTAVIVFAAIFAAWILRRGGEVRLRIELVDRQLSFACGAQQSVLRLEQVEALRYEAPFGVSRSWVPAAVLVDHEGREWRLPALLDAGDRLIDAILRRSDEPNLAAWAQALRIPGRMRRARVRVRLGYAIAVTILGAGLLYYGSGS